MYITTYRCISAILSDRINGFAALMKHNRPDIPLDFKVYMRHVYFDVADFPQQKQPRSPLKDVNVINMLYGSDTPYTPNITCIALSDVLKNISGLSEEDKNKLFAGNVIRLIPRLADVLYIEVHGKSVCYHDMPLTTCEKIGKGLRALVSKVVEKDKTKNNSSYRAFPLFPEISELLLRLKDKENKNREFFGNAYIENDYIFKRPNGDTYDPSYITHRFGELLKKYDLPHIRFHDLRHSCASLLLS